MAVVVDKISRSEAGWADDHLLMDVYHRLRAGRGHQGWWPGNGPYEVVVGAVLTQNTAWSNVEKAIGNLRAAGVLDPHRLAGLGHDELAALLKPAGYFNVKARRLRALNDFLLRETNGDVTALGRDLDTATLRSRLLAVPGVGRETADSILLYALGRPVFVVDAYTRRIFGRMGLVDPTADYDDVRDFFETRLRPDPDLYNDYHAQIVIHGKETCRTRPRCGECPLRSLCLHATGGKKALSR